MRPRLTCTVRMLRTALGPGRSRQHRHWGKLCGRFTQRATGALSSHQLGVCGVHPHVPMTACRPRAASLTSSNLKPSPLSIRGDIPSLRQAAALSVIESACTAAREGLDDLAEDRSAQPGDTAQQPSGARHPRMWVFGKKGGLLIRPIKVRAEMCGIGIAPIGLLCALCDIHVFLQSSLVSTRLPACLPSNVEMALSRSIIGPTHFPTALLRPFVCAKGSACVFWSVRAPVDAQDGEVETSAAWHGAATVRAGEKLSVQKFKEAPGTAAEAAADDGKASLGVT